MCPLLNKCTDFTSPGPDSVGSWAPRDAEVTSGRWLCACTLLGFAFLSHVCSGFSLASEEGPHLCWTPGRQAWGTPTYLPPHCLEPGFPVSGLINLWSSLSSALVCLEFK